MHFFESFRENTVGKIFFPFSNYLMNRQGIVGKYRHFIHSQHLSPESLQQLQIKKLRALLCYVYEWIPFYRKRMDSVKLVPEDINRLADLKRLPPLSRNDVAQHLHEMIDKRFVKSFHIAAQSTRAPGTPIPFARLRRHRLVKNTSSGSTGQPVVFYEDGSVSACNWAHELRIKQWYGIAPGVKEARMTRMVTEHNPKSSWNVLRKMLWNQLLLPGTNLSAHDYDYCYQQIMKFRPKILWGYTSSFVGLVKYMKKNKLYFTPSFLQLCITWATPLYEHEHMILKEMFGCPITNIYGTREVGHIAALCPHGTYHVNQENVLVESQNNSQYFPQSSTGELLVTTLEKTPMPFIRYQVGDVGKIGTAPCACGRGLQTLTRIEGRSSEIFVTTDGQMIAPHFWCRIFMDTRVAHGIEQFQVIYTKDNSVRIKIVKTDTYTTETELIIQKYIKENFYHDMLITFDFVDSIQSKESGKYQLVIHEA